MDEPISAIVLARNEKQQRVMQTISSLITAYSICLVSSLDMSGTGQVSSSSSSSSSASAVQFSHKVVHSPGSGVDLESFIHVLNIDQVFFPTSILQYLSRISQLLGWRVDDLFFFPFPPSWWWPFSAFFYCTIFCGSKFQKQKYPRCLLWLCEMIFLGANREIT